MTIAKLNEAQALLDQARASLTATALTAEIFEKAQSLIMQIAEQMGKPRQITIASRIIELQPGECYAGAKLHEDGTFSHDVIVLAARFEGRKDWQGVQDWTKAVGGAAPSPEEFALIKANCADVLTESWYWTDRTHEDEASYAWDFHSHGYTGNARKSYQGGALAVRRS